MEGDEDKGKPERNQKDDVMLISKGERAGVNI